MSSKNVTHFPMNFDGTLLTLEEDFLLNQNGNLSVANTIDGGGYGNFTLCPSVDMPHSNIIFMLLYAIVCIVGLMGNTLVIYVVLRFSNMQTVTNMYILNLAIADECFLIGIPFLIMTMHLRHWTFGATMCKAYMVSTSITQFTSSIFLLIMSADRYIAICHHISSPKYRTPWVSRIVSAIAWKASAVFMLPIMLYANTITAGVNGRSSCGIIWPEQYQLLGFSFTLYSLTLGFVIPLCFIMTFYLLVIRKLRTVGQKTNKSRNKRKSHKKVTKLVLTVITVYILFWLPYWISQVALITSSPDKCNSRLEIILFLLVGLLAYSNSAVNPILYAYLSDNFKKSFLKACTCAATKDVNAQLKLESSMLPHKIKNRPGSMTRTTNSTKCHKVAIESMTVTTTTGISAVSSRNPSPPNMRPPNPNHNHNLTVTTSLTADNGALLEHT